MVGNFSQTRRIRILLADSKPIESQLLTGALTHEGFEVVACAADLESLASAAEHQAPDVIIVNCSNDSSQAETSVLRSLHATQPHISKVALLQTDHREAVVQAFRAGARGIFSLSNSSFPVLC